MKRRSLFRRYCFLILGLFMVIGLSGCKAFRSNNYQNEKLELPQYFNRVYIDKSKKCKTKLSGTDECWYVIVNKELDSMRLHVFLFWERDPNYLIGKLTGRHARLTNEKGEYLDLTFASDSTIRLKGYYNNQAVNKKLGRGLGSSEIEVKSFTNEYAKTVLVSNENEDSYVFTQKVYRFKRLFVELKNAAVTKRLNEQINHILLQKFDVTTFDEFAQKYNKQYTASGDIVQFLDRDLKEEIRCELVSFEGDVLIISVETGEFDANGNCLNNLKMKYKFDVTTGDYEECDSILIEVSNQ
ncbi:hypothetical protein NWE55_01180 [Myroides albus]|uniref:Lipoprotein n=1 Tax=Myroides albus TaxID=2562892 RepID=A0A6I3LGR5_9FLAO|nr:hypothetical protein [Myroides albus]MTG98749.1 hypothetical protein [Myroides albus]UVD79933.1 hypothetical protein NWE55_01180 [Myroides albus]